MCSEMIKVASKKYKWILLALICATYFLAQGTRQIFNTVLPQIKADFAGVGIDDAPIVYKLHFAHCKLHILFIDI